MYKSKLTLSSAIIINSILTCLFIMLFYVVDSGHTLSVFKIISLFSINIVPVFVILYMFNTKKTIDINFNNIIFFFGIFYTLYFILPFYIVIFFLNTITDINLLIISSLITVGFICFSFGIKYIMKNSIDIFANKNFNQKESVPLLIICVMLILLVIYYWIWRINNNIFYNQAFFYEQSPNLLSSFRDVFIQSTILPLIVLLGLLNKSSSPRILKFAKFIFISYSISTIILYTLSSQTRPAITAILLFIASLQIFTKVKIKIFKSIMLLIFGIVIIVSIQGQRHIFNQNLVNSRNQFVTATNNIFQSTTQAFLFSQIFVGDVSNRASGNILFLSDIIDKTNEKGYLYGEGIFLTLEGLIPRVLYNNKPVITSPQIIVKSLLGLPLEDDSLTAINQFYVEFGFMGIIVGFFTLGYFLAKYLIYLSKKNTLAPFIFFSFIISQLILMELELITGLLGALRNAAVVYIFYIIIKFFVGGTKYGNGKII